MPAQQAGQFSVFWSLLVPALMASGSILITYLLYKHFAGKMDRPERQMSPQRLSQLPKTHSLDIMGRRSRLH
jgi:hypothetical protein